MSKGVIIHLDDDNEILNVSENYFKQCQLYQDLELITCETQDEFKEAVKKNKKNIRCLIFDLVGHSPGREELDKKNAKFLEYVTLSFAKYNIPIFIYSGYLEVMNDVLPDSGTVFKIEKVNGINVIFDKIALFHESGFLDVFCPKGILETEIYDNLHRSFVEQFKHGEIENIINSVKISNPENIKNRSIEIFKRIAARALMSKLLSPVITDETTVNPIEHYYRRISDLECWTGDIFSKKDNSETVIILTPRCDVANRNTENLIVCEIKLENPQISNNKKERIKGLQDILTDNIKGKVLRWLPKSPVFYGGSVNFSKHKTISKNELKANYNRIISLSDDLTNELLGKFSYFFLRTGINTINADEYNAYITLLEEILNE